MNALIAERPQVETNTGYRIVSVDHDYSIDPLNLDTFRFVHLIRVRWADDGPGPVTEVFHGYGATPQMAREDAERHMQTWQRRMNEIGVWHWDRKAVQS